MDGKLAAHVAFENRPDHFGFEWPTEDDFVRLLMKSGAAVAERRRHINITRSQRFFDPRAMAVVVPLYSLVSLSEVFLGHVGDLRLVDAVPVTNACGDLGVILDMIDHFIGDLLCKVEPPSFLSFSSSAMKSSRFLSR